MRLFPEDSFSLTPRSSLSNIEPRSAAVGLVSALGLVVLINLFIPHTWRPPGFSQGSAKVEWLGAPLDYDKIALITETRMSPQLIALFLHFVMVVPPEWPFLFVGSEENLAALRASDPVRRIEEMGKARLEVLAPRFNLSTQEMVSRELTRMDFYDTYVGNAEHLLIWQTDSILCANSKQTVNDYLEYDYVGAPWVAFGWGGNGGLSYRKMSKIRKVIRESPRPDNINMFEDGWLVTHLLKYPDHKMCPEEVAKKWVVESIWEEEPMGYHLGHEGQNIIFDQIWLNPDRYEHIKRWCPEVNMVLRMLKIPPESKSPYLLE